MSGSNNRIARNIVFMSARMLVVLALTFVLTRKTLDILGVVDFGVYNVVCGFVSMFTFLNNSIYNGIQRFYNIYIGNGEHDGEARIYTMSLLIQGVLALLVIVLAESVGMWYMYNKMVIPPERFSAAMWIFQFSVLSFAMIILQAPFGAAVVAHERMDFLAVVSVLDVVLKLVMVVLLQYADSDRLILYGAGLCALSGLNILLYVIYCKHNFPELRWVRSSDKSLLRQMLVFSGWNVFGTFGGIIKEQGVNLVLNMFFGPVVNAARAISMQVAAGIQSVIINITIPVRPQVVQSYASGDVGRSMRLTYAVSKVGCLILYALALPVIAEIDYILSIWIPGNVPPHSAVFVILVLLANFPNNLNTAVSGVVHASGRMRNYQLAGAAISVLSVPVAYLVVRYGGKPEYALLVMLVTAIVTQTVALLILKTIVNYSVIEYVRKVLFPLLMVIAVTFYMPMLLLLLMDEGVLRLFVTGVVSVGVVTVASYFIALSSMERAALRNVISTWMSKNVHTKEY